MDTNLSGKTILITGAGQGLGPNYAEYLAQLGANIVVHDSDSAV